MIRNDYFTGSFPISRRVPVICTHGTEVKISYNNYDLKQVLSVYRTQGVDKEITCFGVWPGKINTDIFLLDQNYYGYIAPPEIHKDIDSAKEITVRQVGGVFSELEYIPGSISPDQTPIISKDPLLFSYVSKAGLRYKVSLV